ncbi:MAG: amidohydrolase [Anaerolineaceae bacterium]|nr:amidohydrolase [Anaerolineaceae bacterium]
MDKTNADLIIKNGAILTMNKDNDIFEIGSVAIKDNLILAVGPTTEISSKYNAEEMLDADECVVMPGLVDTHFHTGQQFERGMLGYLSKDKKLKEPAWLNYLITFEASLSDDDIYLSALLAYSNMLKVGTTCFADAGGPRPEMMGPAIEKTGIRGILARSTLDLKEGVPAEMQDTPSGIVAKGESLFKEWNGRANGRIRAWMGMRQIMICSREVLENIKGLADQLNTRIHIHLAEGTYEVDYSIVLAGLRPTEYLDSIGFLGPNVHAAHSVLLSDKELDLYQQHNISVAHCPAAAFDYCGVAKIPEMLKRGIRVGLGSDGPLASGGSLSLFRQMDIAYYGHVVTYGLPYYDLAPIQPIDFLQMATIGGAKALSGDDEIGSLEAGKKADMILLSRDDLDVLPSYDPEFLAASNANTSQVKTVLVDGKVVVKDGGLVNIDEQELKARVKERSPEIISRFLKRLG